ncbi:hypothetical protein [uncultured Aquabacterium sp.]|uniref:hypothetical protein n=1 Tax=uncultured Aquabacterium sp. TaxID=158753 RepID=UPI0025CC259F|nr:hypothetical protein [uncultured Aquabacterium sp.]
MKEDQQTKESLRAELAALVHKVPRHVANGSIQAVRAWQAVNTAAAKILAKPDATVRELQGAVANLRRAAQQGVPA